MMQLTEINWTAFNKAVGNIWKGIKFISWTSAIAFSVIMVFLATAIVTFHIQDEVAAVEEGQDVNSVVERNKDIITFKHIGD